MSVKAKIGSLVTAGPIGFVVKSVMRRRPGKEFSLSLEPLPSRTAAAVCFGLLERAERRLVSKYLSAEFPVVELGSAFGVVTQAISYRTFDARPDIVCVEANPALAAYLSAQVACSSRIKVIHAAVVPVEMERATLQVDPGGLGSHVLLSRAQQGVTVPALTLRQIVGGDNFEKFSIVCDIEGMEFELFRMLPDDLWARCQSIICELHPFSGPEADEFLARANSRGFSLAAADRFSVALVRA